MSKNRNLLLLLLILLGIYFFVRPQRASFFNPSTITVSGSASTEQTNQVASFNAGVYSINDDKDIAVNEVNSKIEQIITSLQNFDIPESDIKTQNLSIYQMEEPTSEGSIRTQPGQWRVSTDIQVTLRDVARATELATLLTASGANNVYGPNFTIDEENTMESDLLNQAVKNASTKAESVAQANGKRVGKIVAIVEGGAENPVYPMRDMLNSTGGAALMPGSTTVSKTVSVTFELK